MVEFEMLYLPFGKTSIKHSCANASKPVGSRSCSYFSKQLHFLFAPKIGHKNIQQDLFIYDYFNCWILSAPNFIDHQGRVMQHLELVIITHCSICIF